MAGTLMQGSSGPDVKELQRRLNLCKPAGTRALAVDGVFGALTSARVREFQLLNGLNPDGIIGEKTEKTLVILTPRDSSAELSAAIRDWNAARADDIARRKNY